MEREIEGESIERDTESLKDIYIEREIEREIEL